MEPLATKSSHPRGQFNLGAEANIPTQYYTILKIVLLNINPKDAKGGHYFSASGYLYNQYGHLYLQNRQTGIL